MPFLTYPCFLIMDFLKNILFALLACLGIFILIYILGSPILFSFSLVLFCRAWRSRKRGENRYSSKEFRTRLASLIISSILLFFLIMIVSRFIYITNNPIAFM